MILAAILTCEVAFWVVIAAGLATRYLLRRSYLGGMILAMAPVIDVILLVLVTVDLLGGGTASWEHSLAAIYVGISIAYGKRMVNWADIRFKHRFAGGPAPQRLTGTSYTIKCWKDVLLTGLAVGIAAAILWVMIRVVGDPERTVALSDFFHVLGIIFAIDFIWALSYTVWPRKPAASSRVNSVD